MNSGYEIAAAETSPQSVSLGEKFLRTATCANALAGGRSLAEVRDAAGHVNVATTSVYTHVVRDDDEPGDIFKFEQ